MEDSYGFDPAAPMNQYPQQPVYVADANAYDYHPNAYVSYETVPPTQHCPTQGLYPPGDSNQWGASLFDPYSQSVPEQEEEENDYEEYVPYEEEEKEQPRVQLRATVARPAQQVPAPVVAEPTPPVETRGRKRKATPAIGNGYATVRKRRDYNITPEKKKDTPEYKKTRQLNNEASARCRDKKKREQEEEKQQLWSTLSVLRSDIDSLKAGVEADMADMRLQFQSGFDHLQRTLDQLVARIDEREKVVRL